MNCYMIVLPPGSAVEPSLISDTFQNHHEVIAGEVWIVATELDTPVSVCEQLGIWPSAENGSSRRGVVTKISGYFGLFDNALWEKMAVWRAA